MSHSGPYKKDGLLLKDNWGLSEKNAGKWQSSRFLQNDGFFWAARSEQASKAHVRNKRAIKHLGKLYLPTTCRVEQKFVDERDPTILYGDFVTCTQSFCRHFARACGFIAIRSGPWPLRMNFNGDGQVKISPYKMVRFCSGAALPLPCVFRISPQLSIRSNSFVRKWAQLTLQPVF